MKLNTSVLLPATLFILVVISAFFAYLFYFNNQHEKTPIQQVLSETDIPEFEKSGNESSEITPTPTTIPTPKPFVVTPTPHYTNPTNLPTETPFSQKDLILENAHSNANYLGFQICMDQSKSDSDRCFKDCEQKTSENRGVCSAGFDNLSWSTDEYSECLDEISNMSDACGDECLSNSEKKGNECEEKFPQ